MAQNIPVGQTKTEQFNTTTNSGNIPFTIKLYVTNEAQQTSTGKTRLSLKTTFNSSYSGLVWSGFALQAYIFKIFVNGTQVATANLPAASYRGSDGELTSCIIENTYPLAAGATSFKVKIKGYVNSGYTSTYLIKNYEQEYSFTIPEVMYTVTCNHRILGPGTVLGTTTAQYAYGTTVSGASFSAETYPGYAFNSDSTSIQVSDTNKNVYKYYTEKSYNVTVHHRLLGASTDTFGTTSGGARLYSESFTPSYLSLTGYSSNSREGIQANSEATDCYCYYTENSYQVTIHDRTEGSTVDDLGTRTGTSRLFSASYIPTYATYSGFTGVNRVGIQANTTGMDCYCYYSGNAVKATLNPNGGSVNPTYKMVQYEKTYGVLPVPYKKGYNFLGWYTSLEGGTLIEEDTVVSINADHTIYAHWEKKSRGWIFKDGEWKPCVVYVYGNGRWNLGKPMRETHREWKETHGR